MDNASKKQQQQPPKPQTKKPQPKALKKGELDYDMLDLLKTTPKPNLTLSCIMCSKASPKIFTSSCTYHHQFCFNCLYRFFFLNISASLNTEHNKTSIIIRCPLCSNSSITGTISIPSQEFISHLAALSKSLPTNYTKSLGKCSLHTNPYTKYCNSCCCYICDLCTMAEHKKHSYKVIKEYDEELKRKINELPLKYKSTYESRFSEINAKNEKGYNDIYQRTVNEIDKLIHSLEELKKLFEHQMKVNYNQYKTYSNIIHTSFNTYYNQLKETKSPFVDYGIPHLTFLTEILEEVKSYKFNINPSVFQEVESARKKIEGLISNTRIASTITFTVSTEKVHEIKNIRTIKEHSNYINQVIYNKDINRLITCSDDKMIKVFDVGSDFKSQTLKGHNESIKVLLLLTPNKLVSGSDDKIIKIWENKGNEFKCVSNLKGHTSSITHILSIPNEDNSGPSMKLISASEDNTVRVWDPKGDYKNSAVIQAHNSKINDILYLHSKQHLLTCSSDSTIKVFDLAQGNNKLLIVLKEHNDSVNQLTLINDNKMLISCGDDCNIIRYEINEDYKCKCKSKGHRMAVTKLKVLTDDLVGSIGKDKCIKIWDLSSHEDEFVCCCVIDVHKWEITDFAFDYDNKVLYTSSQDKTVKAVKLVNWSEFMVDRQRGLLWKCDSILKGHERDVMLVGIINSGIVYSVSHDLTIKLWKEE